MVNGRATNVGEWEGTVMVIVGEGGLCTGMFIHPEVVMTAGHCCITGVMTISGGKQYPGNKLAQSKAFVKDESGDNDFCLLHLDTAVRNVPIYEVATSVSPGNAIIVGYGVSNSGSPQTGSGTQREGLVDITSVSGADIYVTGRRGEPYQNACNGDSGGPIFVQKGQTGELVVGGVTSRGSFLCPDNSRSTYTSAVFRTNAELITATTRTWLGASEEILPGRCPVTFCCYAMECAAADVAGPAAAEH